MRPRQTIVVHNFTYLDTNTIERKLGVSKRTAESIEWLQCLIVPNTAETVDASLVEEGKYHPELAASANAV